MFRYINFVGLVALFFFVTSAVSAQEVEERIVDEVIAVVNEGVITLSRLKREIKLLVDTEVEQGKNREEVERDLAGKKGELIASLINEELLLQRGKDLKVDTDVEAVVNQRFLQIMKEYNLKTLDALYAEMQKQGVNPRDIRELWRKQATREEVIRREVQLKLYWQPGPKELKEYFDANKSKFLKPETVTLSEIFLNYAGRSEDDVRRLANSIVAQLRAGADFEKLVVEHSERPDAAQTKGKVDTFPIPDLEDKIQKAIQGKKPGEVTDPIDMERVGLVILRIDARKAASTEANFDENEIRMAILQQRFSEEQKKFMATLREDAYIKINESYRPIVAPILYAEERKGNGNN
jgi:hypothetical protein